jgi:uncharacterized membrane protein (DUF4010 family)
MPPLPSVLTIARGLMLALALGFLIGRTREPEPGKPPRPGLRDFVIISVLGAVCSVVGLVAVTVTAFAGLAIILAVMRAQQTTRAGITTEIAALLTFVVGYMAMTPASAVAAGVGIVIGAILATKEQLRSFARDVISDREYLDTLGFLALIYIILPLLPGGGFGPFGFFEPRRIWFFVILVSGVSYVGYFLTKFLGPESGQLATAIVGGLASTTAYTSGAAKAVADAPDSAIPMARAALIANSILFPRLLILAAFISPELAIAGVPSFAVMTAAGLGSAWILARGGAPVAGESPSSGFKNPFQIGTALRFGVVFAAVLLLTKAGRFYFGSSGQLVSSAIGGLIDADAVTVSLSQFYAVGTSSATNAIIGMALAAGVNAIFKTGLAQSSGQLAFSLRLAAGFAIMFGAGAAFLYFVGVPPIVLPG